MYRTTITFASIITAIIACFILQSASAQDGSAEVVIKTTKLTDSVYMLQGRGGNIGLSIGEDGVFMIDDQFADLSDKIKAAVAKLTDKKIKFLINTHWHFDHVGGNEILGKSGIIIVAHENVRKRMSTDQFLELFNRKVPASPEIALPIVTFTDAVNLYLNGDEIHVQHVQHAHTDGDSLVYFKKANVLHMGDTFFNGMYPFIDTSSEGNIDGMIKAAEKGIKIANKKTKIIPGHGPLATRKDLVEYCNMLIAARDLIKPLVDQGKSLEEVIAAKPTAKLDEVWGKGFMQPDNFVTVVYDGMVKE